MIQGSTLIYNNYLHPFYREHEREIDHFMANLSDRTGGLISKLVAFLWDQARSHLNVGITLFEMMIAI